MSSFRGDHNEENHEGGRDFPSGGRRAGQLQTPQTAQQEQQQQGQGPGQGHPARSEQQQQTTGQSSSQQQMTVGGSQQQLLASHLGMVQQQRQQQQQLALSRLQAPGVSAFQHNPYQQLGGGMLAPGMGTLLNPVSQNPAAPLEVLQRQLQQGHITHQQYAQLATLHGANQAANMAYLQQEYQRRQQQMALIGQLIGQQAGLQYPPDQNPIVQLRGLPQDDLVSVATGPPQNPPHGQTQGVRAGHGTGGPVNGQAQQTGEHEGRSAGRQGRSISAAALVETQKPSKEGEPTRRRGQTRSLKNVGSQSSNYRGVTFHRRTGRWEAHLWDGGKQMYLGGFDSEAKAATAYDFMALKCRGEDACLNFGLEEYKEDLDWIKQVSRDELTQSLRRHSKGFTRGSSKYRGVSLNPNGKWEARCSEGKQKYSYLGLFETEELAAAAYDRVCVRRNGKSAVTNFDIANYPKELSDHFAHKSLLEASRADTARTLGGLNVPTQEPSSGTPRTAQGDSPSAGATQRAPASSGEAREANAAAAQTEVKDEEEVDADSPSRKRKDVKRKSSETKPANKDDKGGKRKKEG